MGVPEAVGVCAACEADMLPLRVGDCAADADCESEGEAPTELRLGEGLRVGDELRMLGDYDALRVAAAAG